jgi:hypothetical protein
MDTVVSAVCNLFTLVTGAQPKFRVNGGSTAENLALQNIQVRWLLAQSKSRQLIIYYLLG